MDNIVPNIGKKVCQVYADPTTQSDPKNHVSHFQPFRPPSTDRAPIPKGAQTQTETPKWPKSGRRCFCELIRCPFRGDGYMTDTGVCAPRVIKGHILGCVYVGIGGELREQRSMWATERLDIHILAALAKSGRLKRDG